MKCKMYECSLEFWNFTEAGCKTCNCWKKRELKYFRIEGSDTSERENGFKEEVQKELTFALNFC